MSFREFSKKLFRKFFQKTTVYRTDPFAISNEDLENISDLANDDCSQLFFAHTGRIVHKWIHYLPIYHKEFARFRNSPVKFLEIGVNEGGSLELWRKYFGSAATIFGIDIDPRCKSRVSLPNEVRIGSQDDENFLIGVLNAMGVPDVILDDGSHIGRHQQASFQILFPKLKVGGLYVIEDIHTAYWPEIFEGGYRREGTAIEVAKTLVDDMHGWYHDKGQKLVSKSDVASVRFYNSIVVIEKGKNSRPMHVKVGTSSH
jgi:hypothetical protein